MKRILKVAAVALLAASTTVPYAYAQDGQSAGSSVPVPAVKNSDKPAKVEVMGGHITDAGTVFVDDQDLKSWKITNPKAVKDFKNENVRIDGVKDFKHGTITVKTIRQSNDVISSPGDTGSKL